MPQRIALIAIVSSTLLAQTPAPADFMVEWTDEANSATTGPNAEEATDAYRPTVFAAIQDHLGLRFSPQRVPVRTLVIDQAKKASQN